jgi:DNA-binding HxlR family transcriptional regulator
LIVSIMCTGMRMVRAWSAIERVIACRSVSRRRRPVQISNLCHEAPHPRIMAMPKSYGQFCPVAKAAEVLCERWTPLVLRELMYGSTRFNDLARGVPLMSRATLAQRLRELEDSNVIAVRRNADGRATEYRLTPAGEGLRPSIEAMGMWAQRFGEGRIEAEDLDDGLLIWSFRRALRRERLPRRRVVLRFDFQGLPRGRVSRRSWWLIATPDQVDVCQKDPGFDVDVVISANMRAMVNVWLGTQSYASAIRSREIAVEGAPELVRAIPDLFPFRGEFQKRLYVTAEPLPV